MMFYIFTSGNALNIVTGSRVQEFYGKTWLIFLPIFLQTMYIWSFYEQYIFDPLMNNTAENVFDIHVFVPHVNSQLGVSNLAARCSQFIIIFVLISSIHDEYLLDVVYYE